MIWQIGSMENNSSNDGPNLPYSEDILDIVDRLTPAVVSDASPHDQQPQCGIRADS